MYKSYFLYIVLPLSVFNINIYTNTLSIVKYDSLFQAKNNKTNLEIKKVEKELEILIYNKRHKLDSINYLRNYNKYKHISEKVSIKDENDISFLPDKERPVFYKELENDILDDSLFRINLLKKMEKQLLRIRMDSIRLEKYKNYLLHLN